MSDINFGILQPGTAPSTQVISEPQSQGLLGGLGDLVKGLGSMFPKNPVSTTNAAVQDTLSQQTPAQITQGVLGGRGVNPQYKPQSQQQQYQQSPANQQTNSMLSIPGITQAANQVFSDNPTMAKLAISQAAQESGLLSGQPSMLATKANNLFGMKGTGTAGSISMPTTEVINGKPVQTTAQFAAYKTPQDSLMAYKDLMSHDRYHAVNTATSITDAAKAVQKAGYATDPNYANKLTHISSQLDSNSLHNPANQMSAIHSAVQASSQTGATPYSVASQYLGDGVHNHSEVLSSFFQKSGMGNVNPKTTPWCAAFANSVLMSTGHGGTGGLNARSFLQYGQHTGTPTQGDVVVFKDLTSANSPVHGHVGFYAGEGSKPGYIKVLGGNEDGQVKIKEYPTSKVLDYRIPPTANELASKSQRSSQQQSQPQQQSPQGILQSPQGMQSRPPQFNTPNQTQQEMNIFQRILTDPQNNQ